MIKEKIEQDLKTAVKSQEKIRLEVLRMLKSEIRYKEIEKRQPLTDEDVIGVLSSSAKRRRESIDEFKRGNRPDLVAKEEKELAVVMEYLPQQLSETELKELIASAIREVGAATVTDAGKVMKVLMPQVKGRADGRMVNACVQEMLSP